MKTITYRVAPNYFNERTRSGSWASTFDARVKKKGYESATAVYGPQYMTKPQRGGKGRMTQDLIGYDAVRMKTVEEQAKTNTGSNPSTGANRGAVGSLGMSSGIGTAGSAQAGLVGSVNTEVQNDDMLLPYQKV